MVRVTFSPLLLLPACLPMDGPGTLVTQHTGLAGGYSAPLRVTRAAPVPIYAQAAVVHQRAGLTSHAVFLRQIDTGDWPMRVDSAWSNGQALAFEAVDPDLVCAGLTCQHNLGIVTFDAASFDRLARTGLPIRLITSDGPVDLDLPPTLFSQAIAQASTLTAGLAQAPALAATSAMTATPNR